MTSLNDKIKVIYKGKTLTENRFDIGTTQNVVVLEFTLKNVSNNLLKNLRFTFPMGIDVLEPKELPERMVPEKEFILIVRIDTSMTRTFTFEVEGGFLHVMAR